MNVATKKKVKGFLNRCLYAYPRLFWEFFIFSFSGWIVETVYVYGMTGEWTMRGTLAYGLPIIHIYGLGGLIIIYIIGRLKDKPIVYFIVSAIVLSLVELAGSYYEQYFIGERTWDYAKLPFNFQGRISLSTALGWGTLAFLVEYIIYPEISWLISKIPRLILIYSSIILTVYVSIVTILRYVVYPGFY